MTQYERIVRLADGIINAASQYQVSRELLNITDKETEEGKIYYNFLISILATFDDEEQQEH
jgi:hypothetical protein